MKRFLSYSLAAILVLCSTTAFAQQKFGYVNSQEIIFQMPEIEVIQEQLIKLNDDYTDILETMQVELNTKYQEFQKNVGTYSAAVRQTKERELQELQVRLEEFYTSAQQEIGQTRDELFAPVIEKAGQAIKKIGKENGFFTIFDMAAGATIYIDEGNPNMVDVSPLVKKELGIK